MRENLLYSFIVLFFNFDHKICYNNFKLIDPKIEKLKITKVNLIDENGKQIGIFDLDSAVNIANEKGLDLILITEKTSPPVVKLGNYSKFLYQQKKERKKRQKKELKEIRIGFNEAIGDLRRKVGQAMEFLEEGHQVQIRLMLKGRERLHTDFAKEKLQKFLEMIECPYKYVQEVKNFGNYISVTIVKK